MIFTSTPLIVIAVWYPRSELLYILKQNIFEYIYFILFLSGRKFNKHGELTKDWWDSDSLKHFKKRADCVEKQYSNYKVRGKYKVRLFDKIVFAWNILLMYPDLVDVWFNWSNI